MGTTITGPDPDAPEWPVLLSPTRFVAEPTGATSDITALQDDDDLTFTEQQKANLYYTVECDTYAMPPGSRIFMFNPYVRGWAATLGTHRDVLVAVGDWTGPGGSRVISRPTSHYTLNTTPRPFTCPSRATLQNGQPIDQAALDRGLLVTFGLNTVYGGSNTGSKGRWSRALGRIAYDMPPTCNIVSPTTGEEITSTPTPLITWDYSDDFQPQSMYEVNVVDDSDVKVYDSGLVTSSDTFHQITDALDDGDYTVNVRVYQEWTGAGGAFPANDLASQTFSISTLRPGTPSITATASTEHVELTAQHVLNILNFDESTFDNGAPDWSATGNATVTSTGSPVKSGSQSMKVTLGSSPNGALLNDYLLAEESSYAAAAQVRAASTSMTATMTITFYNSLFATLSTETGTATALTSGSFVRVTHRATAPADTAFARIQLSFTGTSGKIAYVDEAGLWRITNVTDAVPTWSRGGFYVNTNNLLPYPDSGFEDDTFTWAADTTTGPGTAIVRSTTQARRGVSSLRITKSTTGSGTVSTKWGSTLTCSPGDLITMFGSFWSTTARTVNLGVHWYDASHTLLSSEDYSILTSAGAWKDGGGDSALTAPASAVFYTPYVSVFSVAQNELHYLDSLFVQAGDTFTGYQNGYFPDTDLVPALAVQYSDDDGDTWATLESVDLDPTSGPVTIDDYNIPSGVERSYRAKTSKTENGILLESDWSTTATATVTLEQVYLHAVDDPSGTSHHFKYDGSGRSRTINALPAVQAIEGRQFPFAEFAVQSSASIAVKLQCALDGDEAALEVLGKRKAEVVFRDQRGRALRGVMGDVDFDDEQWGATASFTLTVTGEQVA